MYNFANFYFFGRWRPLAANQFLVFYGQTVGNMNKTNKTNMIKNIFVQCLNFYFFCRWCPLAANHFCVFYGQTVGDMNKSYKTDPLKLGSLYPMSTFSTSTLASSGGLDAPWLQRSPSCFSFRYLKGDLLVL